MLTGSEIARQMLDAEGGFDELRERLSKEFDLDECGGRQPTQVSLDLPEGNGLYLRSRGKQTVVLVYAEPLKRLPEEQEVAVEFRFDREGLIHGWLTAAEVEEILRLAIATYRKSFS